MFDIILLSLYNILNNGGDRMTLGDIIKRYRNDHALSMDAFSERSGISKAYISLLEKRDIPIHSMYSASCPRYEYGF